MDDTIDTYDKLLVWFAIGMGVVVMILLAVALFVVPHHDTGCPYGDVDALERYGGLVEYTVGDEEHTFAVVRGYHIVYYDHNRDTLRIYHTEMVPAGINGKLHRMNTDDLYINGWQIKEITVR